MKVGARLKQFDFKQFFIDHGEKVGIGAIGLLVALSLWSTNWQRFKLSPEDLKEKAQSAEKTINEQPWPKDLSASLAGQSELNGKVDELFIPINPAQYAIAVPFSSPLHPDNTKITNPRWLAMEDLRADADFVELELDPSVKALDESGKFVHVQTEEEREAARDKAKKAAKKKKDEKKSGKKKPDQKKLDQKKAEEEVPENFKKIEGKGRGVGRAFGLGGAFGRRKDKRREEMPTEPDDAPPAKASKKITTNGRGYRYVAVRGVFPLRAQVEALTHAMGEGAPTKRAEIQDLVEFRDIQLERQTARPDLDDPWTGPWEQVDKERVKEMLMNDVTGYAPETVDARITNNVLCMPYPERVVGVWGEMATHPAIKQFVLTDDEVEQQVKYQEELIRRFKDEEVKKKGDNLGWDQVTKDMRALERRAMNRTVATTSADPQNANKKSTREEILDEIRKNPSKDPAGMDERLAEFVKKRATAVDYLLLFRYLDFMVEPGKTYRYRVRAVLSNPFHTRQIEEVVDPSIVEGETRVTEFSQPTKPVMVPEDAQFYVERADSRVGRSSLPNAQMDLYQWFASTGTFVNKSLTVQIGQFLAGIHNARVLRPSENTFDIEKTPFSTKDSLVDVTQGFALDSTLHADVLAEIDKAAGKDSKRPAPRIPDEALFVDQNGGLMLIDGLDQIPAYDQTKQRLKYQNAPFQNLLEKKDEDAEAGAVDMRNVGRGTKKKGKHRDPRQRKK